MPWLALAIVGRSRPAGLIVPTLCVGMHPVTLCVTLQKRNAERPWRHSHAGAWERSIVARGKPPRTVTDVQLRPRPGRRIQGRNPGR